MLAPIGPPISVGIEERVHTRGHCESGGPGSDRGPASARSGVDRRPPPPVSRGLADTSVFVARESGRPLDADALPDELAVSVITIAELRAGVLAGATVEARDRRLGTLTVALRLEPVPVDDAVVTAWARLRVLLRDTRQRMSVNDSWIAATAMALGVPVATRDDDFPLVEGLSVNRVRKPLFGVWATPLARAGSAVRPLRASKLMDGYEVSAMKALTRPSWRRETTVRLPALSP